MPRIIDNLEIPARNRIINGDFKIDQRHEGVAFTTASNTTGLDRWKTFKSNGGVTSIERSTDLSSQGFSKALKLTVTTADATVAATDHEQISQSIEGWNVADFNFGKATAKAITLSFHVRATKTGISSVVFKNSGSTRSYVAEYTINASNTLEYKTITIPGDTAGVWDDNYGAGLGVQFGLMAGTTYQQAAGSWGAGNVVGSPNQINHLDTVGNTFYITEVQLESGNIATAFEFKNYTELLRQCFRYYQKSGAEEFFQLIQGSATQIQRHNVKYQEQMRASPTIVLTQTSGAATPSVAQNIPSSMQIGFSGAQFDICVYAWTLDAEL